LLNANPSGAQKQRPEPIRVGVNMVLVDTMVRDKNWKILSNLRIEDFIVREDGLEQKIEYLTRDQLPLSVVLVLDISYSIAPFLGVLRNAAATTLAAFRPDDEVALSTFASDVDFRVPFSKDKTKIAREVYSLQESGGTNINDGLFQAAKYLMTVKPKGRRVIILISDDVGSVPGHHEQGEIVDEILEADASLYNLKIPGDNPKNLKSNLDVEKIVEEAGGEVVDVKAKETLISTLSELIQRVRTRYTLGYYRSASCAGDKEHRIDVRLAPSFGSKGQDYVVLSRRGYYCAPRAQVDGGHSRNRTIAGGYPPDYESDSWAGEVATTDDAARTITLTFMDGRETETFTGTLRKNFKVKMSDGTTQELKPSQLAPGRWITVFYIEKRITIEGKKTISNEIFKVDFLN
jgi:VWFA-related protein